MDIKSSQESGTEMIEKHPFICELEVILTEYIEALDEELSDDARELKNETIRVLEKFGFRRVGIGK